MVRHAVKGMAGKYAAGEFRADHSSIRTVIEELARRCAKACDGRTAEVRRHLEALSKAWEDKAAQAAEGKWRLAYELPQNEKSAERLLHSHGDPIAGLWETMQSMRNVEDTGLLKRI